MTPGVVCTPHPSSDASDNTYIEMKFLALSNLVSFVASSIPEIEWNGEKIIVMKTVLISPPYFAENCQMQETHSVSQTKNNGQSLSHVTKIVSFASKCLCIGLLYVCNNNSFNKASALCSLCGWVQFPGLGDVISMAVLCLLIQSGY